MGTRNAWSIAFLQTLGNNRADADTERFVAAWTRQEDTEARYNPLATTLDYGRWTNFNSVGVKNYASWQEGVEAAVYTLGGDHLGYAGLKDALLNNDPRAAILSGGLDTWGSGSARVAAIYTLGDFGNEELKSDTGTSAQGSDPPTQGDTQPHTDPTLPTQADEAATAAPGVSIGAISEDSIRQAAKIGLGLLLITTGAIIAIIALLQSDAAKQTAIATAKVAIL